MAARVLVGRADLLAAAAAGLTAGARVALVGPRGVGKSALLAEVAAAAECAETVLRIAPQAVDRELPYTALAELLAGAGGNRFDWLPEPQAAAANAVLRQAAPEGAGPDPVSVRMAVGAVLERLASGPGLLLVVDNAQYIDPDSAAALSYALSKVPVSALLAERSGGAAATAEQLCGPAFAQITVPPLGVDEVAQLLAEGGLPARLAGRIHQLSGGYPRLVLDVGRTLTAERPVPGPLGTVPLPERTHDHVHAWLAEVPGEVRDTLLVAALAARPTVPLILRAGQSRAEADLAVAATAGLVAVHDDEIRFPAAVVPAVLVRDAPWTQRASVHARLAEHVDDLTETARHRALATDGPDSGIAAQASTAAAASRKRGDRASAAALEMLAAERTPPDEAELAIERLVSAALDAGRVGHYDLARRAARAVLARDAPAEARVRVRLALVDAAGQAIDECEELLAEAAADARADPGLLAEVVVRSAVRANLAGDPVRSRSTATRAAVLAARGGDRTTEVMALTMRARMERVLGDPAAAQTLRRALDIRGPHPLELGNSPQFLTARHALFDDRLTDARSRLLELLPEAEWAGATECVEIVRSLAEVEARAGRCRDALDHAGRAIEATTALGLSPGPTWYTAALAETAGGSFTRAADYARRGARASREERDRLYLARNLYALGVVQLVTGEPAAAARTLRQVRELETAQHVVDPSLVRWHGELAEALAATAALPDARAVLDGCPPSTAPGVLAALDRARAACLAVAGEVDEAVARLGSVAARYAELGLPIEHGRTLLAIARLERRRRRRATARNALETAAGVFADAAARPWSGLAADALDRLVSSGPTGSVTLSAMERRLADLVCDGASNAEAAAQLFVSVKTIEAMLTRIYRKLGVRSRAQLGKIRRNS